MPYNVKNFPSNEEIARIAKEDEYFKILDSDTKDHEQLTQRGKFRLREFFENDTEKAKLLDRVDDVGPSVVEAGTDFLFGEPYVVQVEDESLQNLLDEITDRNKLQRRVKESSKLFQGVGHAHFKLYKKDGLAVIEEIPYTYWFPNWSGVPSGSDPENVRIVVPLNQIDAAGVVKKYIYVEDYFLEGTEKKTCIIEYAAYEDRNGKVGAPVELSDLGMVPTGDNIETQQKPIEGEASKTQTIYRQNTGLDELPLVTVDMPKTVLHRHGESIFKNVLDYLNDINDRLTQVSLEFLKHLNAILVLPAGSIPLDKNGNVDRKKLQVLFTELGEVEAKYITDDNPMIELAFQKIDKSLRAIAKRTKTPDDFLLDSEKGGIEKSETLKTRLMQFFKRIVNYRQIYDDGIKDLYRIALKLEGKWQEKKTMRIVFDYGLPKDWQHDVEVWSSALTAGLASRETAVQRFQSIQDDELQEELEKIKGEEKEQMEMRVNEVLATDTSEQV